MKKRIERLLRRLGLERLIFYYVYLKDRERNKTASDAFEKRHDSFIFPTPFLRFDVIATSNSSYFFESGKIIVERIIDDLERYTSQSSSNKILEWGCGPGRLLQHLRLEKPDWDAKLFGVDMYQPSIKWASENLGQIATFKRNDKTPPLSFAADTFDFVYAVSVFTHLSENLSRLWMSEILRVLKPGGVFWFSSHGGSLHRHKLSEKENEKIRNGGYVSIFSHHDGSQMFEGIHPQKYMEEIIREAGGDVLSYQPTGLQDYQDIWVVKKVV